VTACSEGSIAAGEPLAGTAPTAQCWIVIEQPGPWGRAALTESRLDPEVGRALVAAMQDTGTRVILARHGARRAIAGPRRLWVAHTAPGTAVLREGEIDDVRALLGWDLAAMAAGSLPEFGRPATEPVLFVCTHAKRDMCCAVKGRELVDLARDALPASESERLWECSHLGGHRFAPTALVLPTGSVFGRLTVDAAVSFLRRGSMDDRLLSAYRGRSAFPAPMQAAEARVRAEVIVGPDDLDVLWVRGERAIPIPPGDDLPQIASMLAEVRHVDGRAWRVAVRQEPLVAPRPESCGAEAIPGHRWQALECTPAAPWR
jgi:hypothetical protein